MTHEDYKEMLAAQALGSLAQPLAHALEAHLATCDECRAELEGWREVAALLAYSVEPAAPSASLRARILENARAHTQLSGTETTEGGSLKDSPDKQEASSAQEKENILPFARPKRGNWSSAARLGAIAAALAFAALVVSLFILWQRNNALRAEVASLSQRVNRTQEELVEAREENRMLAAPDTALLAGTNMAPQARGKLTFDKQTGRAMLLAYDLPPAPPGKAYQLWFIAGSHVMPGSVFQPDAQGRAVMREQMPAAARSASIFAVTLEPQGGVPAPTGEKYLLSSTS
ncbi:MAG TPA: anti-sigma factor [Pyrinomonadaceae bacterium]